MAWHTERWLTNATERDVRRAFGGLSHRELLIVGCAELDAALAELLSLRLRGSEKEIISFLGVDGDGRAPIAGFGARIQLSHLCGLITNNDAAALRALKNLRNIMAHRIATPLLTPHTVPHIKAIGAFWLFPPPVPQSMRLRVLAAERDPRIAALVIRMTFCYFGDRFTKMRKKVRRIGDLVKSYQYTKT